MLTHFTPTVSRLFALLIGMNAMILMSGCNASNPLYGSGSDSYETPDGSGDDPIQDLPQQRVPSTVKPTVEKPQPNAPIYLGSVGTDEGSVANLGAGSEDGSGDDLSHVMQDAPEGPTASKSNDLTDRGSVGTDANQGTVQEDGSGDS